MREYKIGEIFKYNSEWYQCVEDSLNSCVNCCFYNGGNKKCSDEVGECFAGCRGDNCSVCFKKLKKVGESYAYNGIVVQKYKLETNQITIPGNLYTYFDGIENTIEIEIKQTKEDMEEKKVQHYDCFFDREPSKSNLKPFGLEAAKAGKPVCTRDGRKARILCFDRFCCDEISTIVACVLSKDGKDENVIIYSSDGFMVDKQHPCADDLMMLPEKKEGWANIYRSQIYDTLERAKEAYKRTCNDDNYLQTIKIEWEE